MRYDRSASGDPVRRPPEVVDHPSWEQVQEAIRRMENFCYPIVTIATDPEEQHALLIVGGPRRFAVADLTGTWQYERPDGGKKEVRLWASNQGYYCRERNIIRSRRKVLDFARAFFETGDFVKVAEVADRPEQSERRAGRAANLTLQRSGAAMTLFDLPKESERGPGR
jgi:hypothetical protein